MGQKLKFEKTTVQTIEAIQFDGSNYQEILDFTNSEGLFLNLSDRDKPQITVWLNSEGNRIMSKDAWLLKKGNVAKIVDETVIQQFIDGHNGWGLVETNE